MRSTASQGSTASEFDKEILFFGNGITIILCLFSIANRHEKPYNNALQNKRYKK